MAFIGMTVGGWGGWALGAAFGTMTAFLASVIGTGVGVYAATRIASRYDI